MKPTDPRLRALLAPARTQLAGVVGAGVAGGLLVLAQAWVVAGLVVSVLDGADIRGWSIAVVVVLSLRAAAAALSDACATRAASVVGTVLRHRLVRAYVDRAGVDGGTGEEAVLATRGVAAAEPYLTRYVPAVVVAALLPPLTVVAIATQDLLSAVIVLATLPLVPVFGALVGLATRDRADEQWQAMAALSGHFLDVVRGLPTLVAHRRARAQSSRIAEVTDRYRRASLRTLRIAFASSAVLELVATLSVALVAVTVGVRLAGGTLGLHTALVVLLLAPEAYWPLRRVGAEFHAAAEGAATFTAAHDLLAPDASPALDGAAPDGADLVLDGVTVSWPGRAVPAIRDLSAVVPARGLTALTGPSGCGKSTLLAAIAGLLPLGAGRISSGGVAVGGAAWQAQVAWLPQQPRFVAGSIADNLRIAQPAATDAALWTALREVALEEHVRALPLGLDTPLGEDGTTLSAGERARLALARAVLSDRPWVLLDEPTAHLDDLTEQVLADTLVTLAQRRGVVVVTHRPRLVALAGTVIEVPMAPTLPGPRRPAARSLSSSLPPPPVEARDRVRHERRGLLGAGAVGALASASGVALTATAGWLIVQASSRPPVLTLMVAIVGVRAFGLARPILRYVERVWSHDAALRLLARRRVEVYDALVPLVPGRLGRRRGDVLNTVVDDVDSVVEQQLRVRLPLLQFTVVGVMACVVAWVLLDAASLVVASSLVLGWAAFLLARRGAHAAEHQLVDLRAALSETVVETVQVASELRMWQRTLLEADRTALLSARIGAVQAAATAWLVAGRTLVLVGTGAAVAAMASVTAGPVADRSLAGPVMALLVLLPLALADVAVPCADAGVLAARTAAARERLRALESASPAVAEVDDPAAAAGLAVSFEDVAARWSPDGPVTAPVTLDLQRGDRVALVGRSGSGKSTAAAVLLRFLDPASGDARFGGAALQRLAPDDVRRQVGLLDEHPHVFATTLVENVRLARPHASDAEVEDALRRAHLGTWLDGLPDGLGTWLGVGHGGLSGGERARLGLARSLLADHAVLVLDEPTAHLDAPTAAALAREVLTGHRDRSVLWIDHGPVGLELVDRTVVLPPGAEGPPHAGATGRTGRGGDVARWIHDHD
ncbi:thiol reductant ABC exporter subunit CydD [Nocardioides jiangxiensis]|uniref:Thiol reductant ABC exporter subunit CydD n=1 Tax=Nocardioides jiangxiensis TaxID=3064524 RepID=A0ABT9AYH3_9ACTN|nr:thiol reductant ABC exporter subunit CydD [Nocardioides sp. WY-20]MDO7867120.1 thiol reductant ABC exporter subunit CydD [Nocardioides sp. WY-20]